MQYYAFLKDKVESMAKRGEEKLCRYCFRQAGCSQQPHYCLSLEIGRGRAHTYQVVEDKCQLRLKRRNYSLRVTVSCQL